MKPRQLDLIPKDEFLLLIDLPQPDRRISWLHEGINEARDEIQRFLNNQPKARQYKLPKGPLNEKREVWNRWRMRLIASRLRESMEQRLQELFERRHYHMLPFTGDVRRKSADLLEKPDAEYRILENEIIEESRGRWDTRTSEGRREYMSEAEVNWRNSQIERLKVNRRIAFHPNVEEFLRFKVKTRKGNVYIIEKSEYPDHPAYQPPAENK